MTLLIPYTHLIAWLLFAICLTATATVAPFAFFRSNRVLSWIAGGLLGLTLVASYALNSPPPPSSQLLIVIAGLVIAVFGGGPAAVLALDLATRGSVQQGIHGGILVAADSSSEPGVAPRKREVLRGGTTIGVLERGAAAATIIAGFPEGLAILVAIKGVGRFTELDAAESRERFIIGTLASLIWACAAAIAVRIALG